MVRNYLFRRGCTNNYNYWPVSYLGEMHRRQYREEDEEGEER